MIKTIAAVGLPVDEVLEIKRNRILPETPMDSMKRISIVTGIHGDELEGQYVCFELQRRIEQNKQDGCHPFLGLFSLSGIGAGGKQGNGHA